MFEQYPSFDKELNMSIPYFDDLGSIDVDLNVHMHENVWHVVRYLGGTRLTYVNPSDHHKLIPDISFPLPYWGPTSVYDPLSVIVDALSLDAGFYWIAANCIAGEAPYVESTEFDRVAVLRSPVRFTSQTFAKVTKASEVFNIDTRTKSATYYRMISLSVYRRCTYQQGGKTSIQGDEKISRLSDYRKS